MKIWTEQELIDAGYELKNAKITSADLSMADHGAFTLELCLEGNGWGCVYGGYILGHGYLGCDYDYFDGSAAGLESIIRIMDVVGCNKFNDMKGKIIRIAARGWGDSIKIIGNVLQNNWFDIDSFFKDVKEEEYSEANNG